jgi:hypothetical protein
MVCATDCSVSNSSVLGRNEIILEGITEETLLNLSTVNQPIVFV